MSAARYQREVQQLFSDGSDEPLGEGVGHGSADRRQHRRRILGLTTRRSDVFRLLQGVHAICSLISLAAASFVATRSSLKPIAVPLSPGPSATD
jgi:hypothetical protein